MKKLIFGLVVGAWAASIAAETTCGHVLWYGQPAEDSDRGWERESLPIGNGWFGISVFGGIGRERLQVTENTVLTRNNLTSALDLRLTFPNADAAKATGYRRALDLETGIASVAYETGGVRFARESFASYPDRVFVTRLTASEKGALAFALTPEVPYRKPFGEGEAAHVGRTGEVTAKADGTIDVHQHLQWYGIRFYGRVRVETDGALAADGGTLTVSNASVATVYFSCGTNYELKPESFAIAAGRENETRLAGPEPKAEVDARVAAAAKKGFAAVRTAHLDDFGGMMRRVELDLGGTAEDRALPTDRLLAEYGKGRASAYLEECYFQYGRYLLVSSSRPGTMPANLQGTREEIYHRKALWEHVAKMRKTPGWEKVYIANTCSQIGPRVTRLMKSGCVVDRRMLAGDWHPEDAVGWFGDDAPTHPAFSVPYRALVPEGVENLLAAGRCLGAPDTCDTFRLICPCFVTGEAAGTAAALAAKRGCTPRKLPYAELRRQLVANGAFV